jgi:uncharacterized protein YjbI with pentapeptide repeats
MKGQLPKPTFYRRTRTLAKWLLIVMALLLLGLIVYWAFWPYRAPESTGFLFYDADSDRLRARTLWDWMGLLIIPAVLALGALWFNKTQKDTELKIAEKARAADREIAEQARATDREIAEARQRQMTLEAYYSRMTELLLTHNLREAAKDAEVRSIATATTVTVIRSLDGERNRQVFAFLRASRLIASDNPVVVLSTADLSNTDLRGVNLRGVDLSATNLSEADLSEADLSMANLTKADIRWARLPSVDLIGANLSQANLSEADLSPADLSKAILREVNLSRADLAKSTLEQADLSHSNLIGTNLIRADLGEANLSDCDLSMARLNGANLEKTNLSGANLSQADLREADGWTVEQLRQVKTRGSAIMPDGTQLRSYARQQDPTLDEWIAEYLAKQERK